jgi:hypothetical protein
MTYGSFFYQIQFAFVLQIDYLVQKNFYIKAEYAKTYFI